MKFRPLPTRQSAEDYAGLRRPPQSSASTCTFVSHSFDGMSVGVAPPFLDWSLVGRHAFVQEVEAVRAQTMMAEACGQFVGNTAIRQPLASPSPWDACGPTTRT